MSSTLVDCLKFTCCLLNTLDTFRALKRPRSRSSRAVKSRTRVVDGNNIANGTSSMGSGDDGSGSAREGTAVKGLDSGTGGMVSSQLEGQGKGSAPTAIRRVSSAQKEKMRAALVCWVVWIAYTRVEAIMDNSLGRFIPFYDQFKLMILSLLVIGRGPAATFLYTYFILPHIRRYSSLIDSSALLISLVAQLISQIALLITVVPCISAYNVLRSIIPFSVRRTRKESTQVPTGAHSLPRTPSRRRSKPSGGTGGTGGGVDAAAWATPFIPGGNRPASYLSHQLASYAFQTPRTIKKTIDVFRRPRNSILPEAAAPPEREPLVAMPSSPDNHTTAAATLIPKTSNRPNIAVTAVRPQGSTSRSSISSNRTEKPLSRAVPARNQIRGKAVDSAITSYPKFPRVPQIPILPEVPSHEFVDPPRRMTARTEASRSNNLGTQKEHDSAASGRSLASDAHPLTLTGRVRPPAVTNTAPTHRESPVVDDNEKRPEQATKAPVRASTPRKRGKGASAECEASPKKSFKRKAKSTDGPYTLSTAEEHAGEDESRPSKRKRGATRTATSVTATATAAATAKPKPIAKALRPVKRPVDLETHSTAGRTSNVVDGSAKRPRSASSKSKKDESETTAPEKDLPASSAASAPRRTTRAAAGKRSKPGAS